MITLAAHTLTQSGIQKMRQTDDYKLWQKKTYRKKEMLMTKLKATAKSIFPQSFCFLSFLSQREASYMPKSPTNQVTCLTFVLCSSSGLRSHGGTDEDAVLPVERLVDQRHACGAASTEDDGIDDHALRALPGRVHDGALAAGGAEPLGGAKEKKTLIV
jgi:hypothetical protein